MTIAAQMLELAVASRQASRQLANLSMATKNELLLEMAAVLESRQEWLQQENAKDLERAVAAGMAPALLDRLTLTEERIIAMADGLREVAALPDPVGEMTGMWLRPNGIRVGRQRACAHALGLHGGPALLMGAVRRAPASGCVPGGIDRNGDAAFSRAAGTTPR